MLDCSIITCCEKKRDTYITAKNYEKSAIRFIRSLRMNGGKCKDLPVYMWYGKDKKPSDNVLECLTSYGAILVEGECENHSHPLFNKITAMQTPVKTEYAMWMDSDIYILKDPSALLCDGSVDVSAAPVSQINHFWARSEDTESWKEYYKLFNINIPIPTLTTHIDQKEGNFYLCSGLILFKTTCGFASLYREIAHQILNSNLPDKTQSFTQTALTLATLKGKYKYRYIPEKLHFVYALRGKLFPDTVIVHYQDSHVVEIKDWDMFNEL